MVFGREICGLGNRSGVGAVYGFAYPGEIFPSGPDAGGGWGVFCVGDDGGRAWFSVRGRPFHNPPRRAAPYSPAHRISFLKTFAVLHKLIRPLPQLYHESGSLAPI